MDSASLGSLVYQHTHEDDKAWSMDSHCSKDLGESRDSRYQTGQGCWSMVKMCAFPVWLLSSFISLCTHCSSCHCGCTVSFPQKLQKRHEQTTYLTKEGFTLKKTHISWMYIKSKRKRGRSEHKKKRRRSVKGKRALQGSSTTTALQPQLCQITSSHSVSSFYETLGRPWN